MPTIRRRDTGKWQAIVRLVGLRQRSRTFHLKSDAIAWARQTEGQLLKGDLDAGLDVLHRTSLATLIERYRDTVTIHKKSAASETVLIDALLRQPFTGLSLAALTPRHFADYRDARLRKVKSSTINHDLTILNHVYKMARAEWAVPVTNPLAGLRRPKADRPRDRRLMPGELDRLLHAADECRNRHVRPVIEFAIETAMRRGEILSVTWRHVDLDKRVLHIPNTKTGTPRTIPLSPGAMAVLTRPIVAGSERPFPLTIESFHMAWKRLVKRAKLIDLHFHDLRHEGVSKLFELGLTIPEVALVSGHKDVRMLFRYTHLRAEDVGAKLWSAKPNAGQAGEQLTVPQLSPDSRTPISTAA